MANFKGYIYKFTSLIDPSKCYIGKTFHIGSRLNNHLTGRGNTSSFKCKKPIIQYNLDGEFIREWESATDAASFYNINKVNITKCCLGKNKTSNGYIWKYKEE